MKRELLTRFVAATLLSVVPTLGWCQNPAPLSLAREGYVYAGGKYSGVNGRQVMSRQLYAEY